MPGRFCEDTRIVRSVKSPCAQSDDIRPRVGWQDPLQDAPVGQGLGFSQTLKGGRARVGDGATVGHGGDIASRKAGVVVGWSHQTI